MLAADKLLLQSNVKQRSIELREKELKLFNSNFSAVGTQAAIMAGFTLTSFVEIDLPPEKHLAKALLHFFVTTSICINFVTVAMVTFVTVWGGGKALRGQDGSMDYAVDEMNNERTFIVRQAAARPNPSLARTCLDPNCPKKEGVNIHMRLLCDVFAVHLVWRGHPGDAGLPPSGRVGLDGARDCRHRLMHHHVYRLPGHLGGASRAHALLPKGGGHYQLRGAEGGLPHAGRPQAQQWRRGREQGHVVLGRMRERIYSERRALC